MGDGAVQEAMDGLDYKLDEFISKVDDYKYYMRQGRRITPEQYGDLLSSLHQDIGACLNNYPGKDQRQSNRDKMRFIMDLIYDADNRKPVEFDSPQKSLEYARAMMQNMKTAKYDIKYPPARKHCKCWAAPNCHHGEWCKCGRAPPTFRLYGAPDACPACRTPDHKRVEDWDVNYPDNVLRRDIEANIEEMKKSKKPAIVFPKSFGPFQRLYVHQVAEKAGLPTCSLGVNGERRCFVFLNPLQKEHSIAKSSDGEDVAAYEVLPSTTSSEGAEGYGPRGRGSERSYERQDDRSRSTRGRGKSESKGSASYDRGSWYEDKGDKSSKSSGYDKGYSSDKGWSGKYQKW
jgi:hypothetical protein